MIRLCGYQPGVDIDDRDHRRAAGREARRAGGRSRRAPLAPTTVRSSPSTPVPLGRRRARRRARPARGARDRRRPRRRPRRLLELAARRCARPASGCPTPAAAATCPQAEPRSGPRPPPRHPRVRCPCAGGRREYRDDTRPLAARLLDRRRRSCSPVDRSCAGRRSGHRGRVRDGTAHTGRGHASDPGSAPPRRRAHGARPAGRARGRTVARHPHRGRRGRGGRARGCSGCWWSAPMHADRLTLVRDVGRGALVAVVAGARFGPTGVDALDVRVRLRASSSWSPRRLDGLGNVDGLATGIGHRRVRRRLRARRLRRPGRPRDRRARAGRGVLRLPRVQPAAGVAVRRPRRPARDRVRASRSACWRSIRCPAPGRELVDAADPARRRPARRRASSAVDRLRRRRPLSAHRSDHLVHRLAALGWSPGEAVVLLLVVQVAAVGASRCSPAGR